MSPGVVVNGPVEDVRSEPRAKVRVVNETYEWLTPGAHLAQAVCTRPEVRLVLERLDADRYSVFVVLEHDPEDLLDQIIDAESELYTKFRWLPFDVRIMKPSPDWSDEDLKRDALALYERIEPHGAQ